MNLYGGVWLWKRVRESCNLSSCVHVWEDVYGYVHGGWLCVVQLRAERLSKMTVINSFTLGPADCIINHIY